MCPDNIFTGCEVIVHLSFPDIHVQNCNTQSLANIAYTDMCFGIHN